jgi:hypothetical protein
VVRAGESGLRFSIRVSGSRSEVRSSEGSSEGWRDNMQGVGMGGGKGEKSSIGGARMGSRDGLG